MLPTRRLLTLLLICLAAASCRRPPPANPDDVVVIRVGESTVTAGELRAAMARRGGATPSVFLVETNLQALVGELVDAKLQLEAARAAGYFERLDVKQEIERMVTSRFREEQMEAAMATNPVTAAEVEAYYTNHLADYTIPEGLQLEVILIGTPAGLAPEKREEKRGLALGLLEQVRTNAEAFGSLAARHSEDGPTRYRGGRTGWLTRHEAQGRWGALIEGAFATKTGQLLPLADTPEGFFIARVADRRPATPIQFATVRANIERTIAEQKKNNFFNGIVEKTRYRFKPIIDWREVKRVSPPQDRATTGGPPGIPEE